MGLLDNQRQLRELRSRRAAARRAPSAEGSTSGSWAPLERRRPNRGAYLNTANPRELQRLAGLGRGAQLGHWLRWGLRGLLVALLVPVQFLILAAHPRELVRRFQEAPSRLRSHARRLRAQSRDRETPAGQLMEGLQFGAHFVDEEIRDMRDGFPSAEELAEGLISWGGRLSLRLRAGMRLLARAPGRLLEAASVAAFIWALGFGLFVAAHGAATAVEHSDALALHAIDVDGASRLSEAELRSALALSVGANLVKLDPAALAARVAAHPWVREATVRVDLPNHRVLLTVVERHADLILAGSPVHLVDGEGVAFKELGPGDPLDLAVLTGLPDDAALHAQDLVREAARGARELLGALDHGRLFGRDDVAEIRWDGDDGYTIVTRDGLPIRVGRSEFGERLRRLERALASGKLPLSAVASVDVSLRDRMVVRPRGPDAIARSGVDRQSLSPGQRARLLDLDRARRGTPGRLAP